MQVVISYRSTENNAPKLLVHVLANRFCPLCLHIVYTFRLLLAALPDYTMSLVDDLELRTEGSSRLFRTLASTFVNRTGHQMLSHERVQALLSNRMNTVAEHPLH